jgi:catalase
MAEKKVLTTSWGAPVDDNQNSITAGPRGPILMQDVHLIDKLAHFDRERIPERVVHAKGAGAHGYFEVTHDVTKYCKAKFLERIGKRTPVFTRFSTVGGERGSADTERDPRGFAVKFYTEEGNWDMTGNNTPIFFIRDPIKFPDFLHTQKRNPQTNLKDPNMVWDFWNLVPEAVHQVTYMFGPRGTPDGYRHMNGYGSHTYKWVNAKGEDFLVKFHFKTDSGIKNMKPDQAVKLAGEDPDYATRDLFNHIAQGNTATWTLHVQIMPFDQADSYKWDVYDVTKVWPHSDFPLIPVGKLVLNRNPTNYFAEVEQSAFCPAHMVPGIETSNDKMLQARLFSYTDTHLHRLGPNNDQIPINCPYMAKVHHYRRDGFMTVNGNFGSGPNYEPNSVPGAPREAPEYKIKPFKVFGEAGRHRYQHPNSDFEQPGSLYRKVFTDEDKSELVDNIVKSLGKARRDIQEKQVKIFYKCDPEYGTRVAQGLGLPVHVAKM